VRRNSGLYGYERALKRVGLDPVAGADEAGRGACAGPLVAAAAILPDAKTRQIKGLNDSKLLTALQRERLYTEITRKAISWAVVCIEPEECDRLGMHVANVLGLAIWKGDRVAACVAAASILAKVTRDRIMCELDTQYPEYAFSEHKGYCTPLHQERLDLHGPSATHRMRFVNVSRTTRVADAMSWDERQRLQDLTASDACEWVALPSEADE
jgi:ribonuclease HII